jgi:putative intracellular protease/amidase
VAGAALTTVLVLAGGTRHLTFDIAAFAALAAVIGWRSRPTAAACAALAWLFFDGFLAGRHAELRWHGRDDVARLGLLIAAAAAASVARWLDATARGRRGRPATPALRPTPARDGGGRPAR